MNRRFKNAMNGVRWWGVPVLIVAVLMAALVSVVYQFVETGPLDTTIEQDLEQAKEETHSVSSTPSAPAKQSSSAPAEQSSGGN